MQRFLGELFIDLRQVSRSRSDWLVGTVFRPGYVHSSHPPNITSISLRVPIRFSPRLALV